MNDRPKVLIVIGQLESGGTERHLHQIFSRLVDDCASISVYALRRDGRLEPEFESAGINVIGAEHHSRKWIGLLRTSLHLLHTLRSERPDVVHYFLPEAYLVGGLVGTVSPRAVRFMSRRSLNRYQKKWPFARAIERQLHKQMSVILGNSRAVLGELREEGVDPDRSAVIYNGVAVPGPPWHQDVEPSRLEVNVNEDAFVVLMVANLIPYKGHEDVLTALAEVKDELPRNWNLHCIGEDRGILSVLDAKARALGVSNQIRWAGGVDDVSPYYRSADIYVSASHEEGFSNAVLEAMSHGLPVVAYAVGGNVEAVVDGETGCLVARGDMQRLGQVIAELSRDRERAAGLGRAGFERVNRHFSISRCLRAYRSLYRNYRDQANLTTALKLIESPAYSGQRPLVILFVVTEDWYFVSHRFDLAVALRARSHRVVVVTRQNRHKEFIEAAGLECRHIAFERSLLDPIADWRAAQRLRTLIHDLEPDVVHLVALKPILLGSLATCGRLSRTPLIWAFSGMGYIFTSGKLLARVLRPLVSTALRVLRRQRNVTVVTQNSDDTKLLAELGAAEKSRVSCIQGSGIVLPEYSDADDPRDGSEPQVVLPARLLRDKGIYEFVAAAESLRARGSTARFILVGRHDTANPGAIPQNDLNSWIERGTVEWLGHIDDMDQIYRQAFAVCLPSYREGLPKVLLEASSYGRPLVATDVPGCRDVCVNERTGLLIPAQRAEALTEALDRLLLDPDWAASLGREGRKYVQARFGLEKIAGQFESLYSRLTQPSTDVVSQV